MINRKCPQEPCSLCVMRQLNAQHEARQQRAKTIEHAIWIVLALAVIVPVAIAVLMP